MKIRMIKKQIAFLTAAAMITGGLGIAGNGIEIIDAVAKIHFISVVACQYAGRGGDVCTFGNRISGDYVRGIGQVSTQPTL